MFTAVLIKNQAFWARVFLLTDRQVLDAYENPLNPINRHCSEKGIKNLIKAMTLKELHR
jgi:hypothetical protein